MFWNVNGSHEIFQKRNFLPTKEILLNHYLYLFVNLSCLLGPFILSFHPRLHLYKRWKSIAIGMLAMMTVFIPWDIFFTKNNIWHFSNEYTLGFKILELPIEEWLFFICVPFACIFTFEVIVSYFPKKPSSIFTQLISLILIVISIALSISYFNHWYTLSASATCVLLLIYHTWKKSEFLGHFYIAWAFLQLPFFISNGVLTGLKFWEYPFINTSKIELENAIVYYNNSHNLGMRIWSVPADDFFYGLVMVLLALTFYKRHWINSNQ